ncbi:hypothetical protein HWQ46_26215 [Shewanella sp. D64]|uniref:hypothetical protein n=1 Tax=unclassified Shewanella TaxID=196818 RepID=UPI0022BA6325|nr:MULTISPECIES: hypothetical protein [unclassified Shewanella]MEC4729012.1 hypothetical protein [Shewanella sp. D64]MEC4740038.1 hypothetical protein [Shewanella sp. E94]WBJ94393.1 hypothetical protein HWQ47_21370 [Shewanella sp. MTB7]
MTISAQQRVHGERYPKHDKSMAASKLIQPHGQTGVNLDGDELDTTVVAIGTAA